MSEIEKKSKQVPDMVSCIIPTYKRSDTLLRAVRSVLNQSYKNIEILVVDDNNPNDNYSIETQKKLKEINDDRLVYIQQKKHINGAVARNVGIKSAKGEYIAFLDDDDEWDRDKIQKQVSFLKRNQDKSGVSCLYIVEKEGIVIRKCKAYSDDYLHKKIIERSISVFTSTVLVKKKALDESGYFNENLLRHQDLQFLLDFTYDHDMAVLEEYLVILHSDSEINHPNVVQFAQIKEKFFEECQKHLDRYNKKEQKAIMSAHYFEIIVMALRSHNYKMVYKYIMKIGINFEAYFNLIKRWRNRKG